MPRYSEPDLNRILLNNPDLINLDAIKRPEELPGNLLQRAWDDSQKRVSDYPVRRSKYGNRKVVEGNLKFDSVKEHRRFLELRGLAETGVIQRLVLQPRYELQEAFVDVSGKRQRKIEYVADFEYVRDGITYIEDVKSSATRANAVFRIKWKILLHKFRGDARVVCLLRD